MFRLEKNPIQLKNVWREKVCSKKWLYFTLDKNSSSPNWFEAHLWSNHTVSQKIRFYRWFSGASRRKWHVPKRPSSSSGFHSGSPPTVRSSSSTHEPGLQMMNFGSLNDLNRSLSSQSLDSLDSFASDNLSNYSVRSSGSSALPHFKGSRIPIIKRKLCLSVVCHLKLTKIIIDFCC